MSSSFPPISKEIIEEMDELFPERSAELHEEVEDVWYRGGQTSVVRFLKQKYEEQQTTIYTEN
jgi:hypothetical protein